MDINPYEVLGVAHDAGDKLIKAAYRRLAADTHPDKVVKDHASAATFQQVKDAYELLIDPARRKRYDTTGRTDDSKVTPERIQAFLKSTISSVIEAKLKNGMTDDPLRVNILDRVLLSIHHSRTGIQDQRIETQRKLGRAITLKSKFIPQSSWDPVGTILAAEVERLREEMKSHEDAMELSQEVERVFKTYTYDLGSKVADPMEGQYIRPATDRLARTPLILGSTLRTGGSIRDFDGS